MQVIFGSSYSWFSYVGPGTYKDALLCKELTHNLIIPNHYDYAGFICYRSIVRVVVVVARWYSAEMPHGNIPPFTLSAKAPAITLKTSL